MKNILLLVFLVASLTVFSQERAKFGFKAGVAIANYNSSNLDDIQEDLNSTRIGAMIGFLADVQIKGDLRFQPEFLYLAQGAKERELRADYLQLPLMLKYEVINGLNVQVGPQIGIKIYEFEDNFKEFDYAVNAGVGVTIFTGIDVEARYSYGLNNVFDDEFAPNIEGKNGVIQIGVTYRL